MVLLSVLALSGCTMENAEVGVKKEEAKLNVTFGDNDKNPSASSTAPTKSAPQSPPPTPQTMPKRTSYTTAPPLVIDAALRYTARLATSAGEIDIALDTVATPVTANNFIFLAREKFYDKTIFHRVIPGFMIQGGDPEGTGRGGPGYEFPDEPVVKTYTRGIVAMANRGPNTNGSQFFIMHGDNPLPKNYVIFGEVVAGMETVDAIASAPTTGNGGGENSRPLKPVMIQSVTIMETAAEG